jgi:uncharacterized protein (TIGR00661 family)
MPVSLWLYFFMPRRHNPKMLILGYVFSITHKTIFISPLDWGLGHASRCVPLIKLLAENNIVIIGTTPLNAFFFEQHFPGLQKINVPSYNIQYSKHLPVWLKILLQVQKINKVIKQENKLLEQIIKEHHMDLVISDNRFGLHHKTVESIFITHQLAIKAPVFSALATKINLKQIHRFTKVWVPDYKEANLRLSGQLSDSVHLKIPVEYIGPQSALNTIAINDLPADKTSYLILLSGIEPQRTILENLLAQKFKNTDQKITLVRGSNTAFKVINKNMVVVNFAFGAELKKLILSAETIICRSGYSTLMDLHVLGKEKTILVPTPGQPEQEYLAAYWKEKFAAVSLAQHKIKGPGYL